MPKPPSNKDAALIENLQCTFARLTQAGANPVEAADRAMNPTELFVSGEMLKNESDAMLYVGYSDLRKRWLLLKTSARSQVFDVAWGATTFLRDVHTADDDLIGNILLNDGNLPREYGKLSDSMATAVANTVITDSHGSYEYDSAVRKINFSESLRVTMRATHGKHVGCSALTAVVETAAPAIRPQDLYGIYWQKFISDFLAEHIINGQPYLTPEKVRPFDS